MEFWFYIIMTFVAFIIIELFFRSIVLSVNKKFQWLIIDRDEFPKLSENGLKKFESKLEIMKKLDVLRKKVSGLFQTAVIIGLIATTMSCEKNDDNDCDDESNNNHDSNDDDNDEDDNNGYGTVELLEAQGAAGACDILFRGNLGSLIPQIIHLVTTFFALLQ